MTILSVNCDARVTIMMYYHDVEYLKQIFRQEEDKMQNTNIVQLSPSAARLIMLLVTLGTVIASAGALYDLYVRRASTTALSSMVSAEQDKYATLKDWQLEQWDAMHPARPTGIEKYFELRDGQVWQLEAVPSSSAPAKVRPQSYAELKDQQFAQIDAAQSIVVSVSVPEGDGCLPAGGRRFNTDC